MKQGEKDTVVEEIISDYFHYVSYMKVRMTEIRQNTT